MRFIFCRASTLSGSLKKMFLRIFCFTALFNYCKVYSENPFLSRNFPIKARLYAAFFGFFQDPDRK